MVEPVRHRRTKGAETDMFEPKATASHLDFTQSGRSRACLLLQGQNGVLRETGKEEMVQFHHDEGVAIGIDPEFMRRRLRGHRRSVGRERIGQPLSRESTLILGADVVPLTEGNTDGRDSASAQTARRGRDTGMCGSSLLGNREISWSASASACCTGPCWEGEEP